MIKRRGQNKEQDYYDFITRDGGIIRVGKEGDQIFYERRGFGRTPEKFYLVTEENEIGIETNGGGNGNGENEELIKIASITITHTELKDLATKNNFFITEGIAGKIQIVKQVILFHEIIGDLFTVSSTGFGIVDISYGNPALFDNALALNIGPSPNPYNILSLTNGVTSPLFVAYPLTGIVLYPGSIGEGLTFRYDSTAVIEGAGALGNLHVTVKYEEYES